MSDLTKVGTSLLDMDSIAEYLNIAKDFVTKNDKATDVEQVAGVDAEQIAVAVNKDDRTTVRNALNLNDHPDTYFLTATEGNGIIKDNTRIKSTYNNEIKELRDELYQLRDELAKSGIVTKYNTYAGYYDSFKISCPEHMYGAVAKSIENSSDQYSIIVKDDLYDKFDVEDKILLKNLDDDSTTVVTIDRKEPDFRTLHFTPASGFNIYKDKCEIYKSKGNLINGTYSFGEIISEHPGNKEIYSCLDDDTYRSRKKIISNNTGFGYTFRVPAPKQKNFLSKIDIQVKKFGDPGALMCYVIDERNIQNWKNPIKAEEDDILIAKSQPLVVDARLGEHIASFNFYDGNNFPLLKDVDTTDHKIRYCFIVKALNADEQNYYELVFLQHKQVDGTFGDLQLNNITYEYTEKEDTSNELALTTNDVINASDLYYGITLREAIDQSYVPYSNGIYTACFETHEPIEITKARLTLRIQREGIFTVGSNGTTYSKENDNCVEDNGVIVVEGESNDDTRGFDHCRDKNIAIGTEIRKVLNVDDERVTIDKGVYAEPNSIIYPINYTITLKANLKTWDPEECTYTYTDKQRYNMDLITIMPDKYKKEDSISDRLIYEVDLDNANESRDKNTFNNFELQIYWESSANAVSERITGRIHNLVVSLDRLP